VTLFNLSVSIECWSYRRLVNVPGSATSCWH